MRLHRFIAVLAGCGTLAFGVAACGDDNDKKSGDTAGLSGSIRIDGSSTVQPLAEAAAELFQEEAPAVKITVGGVGTGDGFKRFCRGELVISDASRAIEKDEYDTCKQKGIDPVEVQVGIDGLSVVANKDLKFPDDCITTEQLKLLLAPKSTLSNYTQLGAGFPNQKASFFTPGTESGTYDYFTETVLETDAEQRTKNVQTSANDNQIVTGIEGTKGALGYVGFSYAEQQKDRLKILKVDGGEGCVEPTTETIRSGEYAPLSRPLFMYPSTKTATRPEVKAYIGYILDNNDKVNEAGGYVSLTKEQLMESKTALTSASPVAEPTK